MKCSTSNASVVASRLFSSSETRPRQKSEESTSVGLKCLRAKVDLPEPDTPTSVTRESSGIVMVIGCPDLVLGVSVRGRAALPQPSFGSHHQVCSYRPSTLLNLNRSSKSFSAALPEGTSGKRLS